jgi:hypothetical protein
MANVKLIFQGTERSKTDENELEVFVNIHNEIVLDIQRENEYPFYLCLDKPTAVRLVRELKKQIGYLESEVNNG